MESESLSTHPCRRRATEAIPPSWPDPICSLIVVIGYYIIQYSWTPWTKYVFILVLGMGVCFVLYEGCIRRFATLRLLRDEGST